MESKRQSTDRSSDSPEEDYGVIVSQNIIKNIIVMSMVFFLNFVAYMGLSNLQSSLHIDEGMGTITQSVLYASMVITCLFVPKLAMQKLGHKWCVTLSLLGYMVWMAANGYAASIIIGICAATLWTGQCSYFTILGKEYSRIKAQKEENVIALFFGIFFMIFQTAGLFSAIISSTVLGQAPPDNYTEPSDDDLAMCGINDCPDNNMTNINLTKPAPNLVWTLVGIYIAIAIAGFIVACIFIDPIPEYLIEKKRLKNGREVIDGLKATVLHLRHKSQLLIIPLTVYSGLSQTFKWADWGKSYITCNIGIWMIGYTSMPFYVFDAIMSMCGGKLVKYTSRIPLFCAAPLLDVALYITYAVWDPDPDHPIMFYILPVVAGTADGIWQTQINALYGALFPEESEAAFANYRLWESAGFIIAFGYSSFLCTVTKLYILVAVLAIGISLYWLLEFTERRKPGVTTVVADNEKAEEMAKL